MDKREKENHNKEEGGVTMNKRGFSLVEIMLVMAIIGLLISLILPTIGKARWKAQMSKCQSKIGNIGKLLEDYIGKAGGSYIIYRTTPGFGSEGDPLPQGTQLWRLLQYEQEDSASDLIKNNPAELRKQIYELYTCNIKMAPAQRGFVSYRGPVDHLTPANMEGGAFIGGDDLLDHGREKNRQINVLLGDLSVRQQIHDDPAFQATYNQSTLKN